MNFYSLTHWWYPFASTMWLVDCEPSFAAINVWLKYPTHHICFDYSYTVNDSLLCLITKCNVFWSNSSLVFLMTLFMYICNISILPLENKETLIVQFSLLVDGSYHIYINVSHASMQPLIVCNVFACFWVTINVKHL